MLDRTRLALINETIYANNPEMYTQLLAARRDAERLNPVSWQRRIARGVLSTAVGAAPATAMRILDRAANRAGFEVIGHGLISTVVRDPHAPDEVLKVNRRLTGKPIPTLVQAAEQAEARHATAQQYLGEIVVPQSYTVTENPFTQGRSTVVARQRFVEGYQPLDIATMDRYDDQKLAQIAAFAGRCAEMLEECGQTPDLWGAGNVGFDTKHILRLVDPEPQELAAIPDYAKQICASTLQAMDNSTGMNNHRFAEAYGL